jgi:hypothetical protein
MPYGVDASMQAVKALSLDPTGDRPSSKAQPQQLLARDDPVLPTGQLR